MRLWHLIALVFGVALISSLARDPAGRVAVVVFLAGLAEIALGLAGIMTLFQTIGSIGEARGIQQHLEAIVATVIVTVVSSSLMLSIFAACLMLINWVAPPI